MEDICMPHQLNKIDIYGLHGFRDYSIRIKDNRLIVVGENGSGKSTILKIIYHTLSCDWDALRAFSFKNIILYFDKDVKIDISSECLDNIFSIKDIDRVVYDQLSYARMRRNAVDGLLNSVIRMKQQDYGKREENLEKINYNTPYPKKYYQDIMNDPAVKKLFSITENIYKYFDVQILYLPTYRRIEEQLKNIFPNTDSDDWTKSRRRQVSEHSIELIEFGMADVEEAVKRSQERLNVFSRTRQNKLTLGYFSEIIEKQYEKVNVDEIRNLSEKEISAILSRIDSNILTKHQQSEIIKILNQVRDTNEQPGNVQEKIICHYFLNLILFNNEISREEKGIKDFVDKCNKYLLSNIIEYDDQSFTCSVYNRIDNKTIKNEKIEFQNLSSGEKQIVSLFSHLNLASKNRVFVFIDEPELSLSVDWQRMFLVDILDSPSCVGLIATTHSPFVFDNALEKYVHGISQFELRR
jgi:predicted ATP-dependent endonuclease of OLD family